MNTILVGVDGGETGWWALSWATELMSSAR
jgi:hypothetical protein